MNCDDELTDDIIVIVEDTVRFSLRLITDDFSPWNKTEDMEDKLAARPWLDLTDFPLESESDSSDVLDSSDLLAGLAEMFPACSSLSCVVSQCPHQGQRESCCDWVLATAILAMPGYLQELSDNYISFSPVSPCPLQESSLASCEGREEDKLWQSFVLRPWAGSLETQVYWPLS